MRPLKKRKICGVREHRVNGQRIPVIVFRDLESDLVSRNFVMPVKIVNNAGDLLKELGLAPAKVAGSALQQEVPVPIDRDFGRSTHRQRDWFGICTGRNHKVILELPLSAMEQQVYSGIYVPVANSRVHRNIRVPLLGI